MQNGIGPDLEELFTAGSHQKSQSAYRNATGPLQDSQPADHRGRPRRVRMAASTRNTFRCGTRSTHRTKTRSTIHICRPVQVLGPGFRRGREK
jgi:hypothetical protein